MGGRLRAGPGPRSVARRIFDRARLLAGDLLPEHPGRRGRDRRDAVRRTRVARRDVSGREIDWAGTAVAHSRSHGRRPRPDRGQQLGLGIAPHHRPRGDRDRLRPHRLRGSSRAGSEPPIVQFAFLRTRNFVGRPDVAFLIISFSMLGMFFFMALYIQNILGYSPLEAGVRFLPTTLVIMVVARPIAGRLTDRIGPRPPIVAGLLARRRLPVPPGADPSLTPRATARCFCPVHPHGLRDRADDVADVDRCHERRSRDQVRSVASGLLSMSRMVGGTFGVAVLGALVSAVGRHDLAQSLPKLPDATRERLVDGLGSGAGTQGAPAQRRRRRARRVRRRARRPR